MAWLLMDDGWLLFDGGLRLPILLLCCCSLAICGVVAQAAIANSIATLRHYIGGFTACADAVSLRSRGAIGLAVQPCSLVPLGGSVLQASTKRKEAALEESRGPIEIWCLLVSYRPASSASIALIELNEQPRG